MRVIWVVKYVTNKRETEWSSKQIDGRKSVTNNMNRIGDGGGQVVSVLNFYSDDPSSNIAAKKVSVKIVVGKDEKEAGIAPLKIYNSPGLVKNCHVTCIIQTQCYTSETSRSWSSLVVGDWPNSQTCTE